MRNHEAQSFSTQGIDLEGDRFSPTRSINPTVSLPDATDIMISSCKGRNSLYPQYLVNISW